MAGENLVVAQRGATAGLPRYEACGASLHWRRWDDEMVVFDAATGSTHLLSPGAAEVLLALLDTAQPLDAAQLAQRLLPGDEGAAPLEADVLALQSVLQDLARLGLLSEEAQP